MWAKLHDNLPDHPKIVKLSLLTKMDRDLARAKLERLWLWALTNRVDGVLSEDDIAVLLPDVMRLGGKQSPQKMVEALAECKLLDPCDGGYMIHDWDEHAGMLKAVKETAKTKSNERVKRYRERQKALLETDESVTCNALQGVTETLCNAPRKDKIREEYIDIKTDTISVSRTGKSDELSTACGKLADRVKAIWGKVMCEEPDERAAGLVARHAVGMDDGAIKYALELACLFGAVNPAAYAARVLNEWHALGIVTEEKARDWRERVDSL